MNTAAFQIFGQNMLETYIMVSGFAVGVPLLAHCCGDAIWHLEKQFSWAHFIAALICFLCPAILSYVIGEIRLEYTKEINKNVAILSPLMLAFFNFFMIRSEERRVGKECA